MDPKERDKGVNPGDSHYNDDFFSGGRKSDSANELDNLENQTISDANELDQSQDDNLSSVRNQEQSGQWENNVNSAADKLEKIGGAKGKLAASAVRKTNNLLGPTAALGVLGGILVVLSLMTGMALPLQLTEIFTAELSDSSAATQVRSERMLASKIDRDMDVSMICRTTTLKCKYKTLSDKQVKKYRAAGFEVNTDSRSVTGRHKINSISLEVSDGFDSSGNHKTRKLTATNAREFNRLRNTEPSFRKVSNNVYNSRVHSYFGKTFHNVMGRLKINKASKLSPEADKETNLKKINKEVGANENAGLRNERGQLIDEDATRNAHKESFDAMMSDHNHSSDESTARNNRDLSRDPNSPGSNPTDTQLDSNGNPSRLGGATIAATGGACAIYEIPRLITAGVKTVKIGKLTAYAIMIMSEVHKVKAGKDTDGRTLRLIGEILSSGQSSRTNVSDSTSMQLALTGSSPGITPGSEDFVLSSGGLLGVLDSFNGFTDRIINGVGGMINLGGISDNTGVNDQKLQGELAVRTICLLSEAADVAAIGAGLFTGGATWVVRGVKFIIDIAIDVVVGFLADRAITEVIKRASGLPLNADTTDGNAADAIFIGRALIDNSKSASYGLGPSTAPQIEEYTAFKNQISTHNIAMDIEDAKDTPFDIYNQYSFLGMAVRNINLGLGMNTGSIANRASGILSLLPSAISTAIIPKAGAAYTQPHAKFNPSRYTESNDQAVASVGAAPDMFGNVRYSMSPRERNLDSEKVLDFMVEHDYVDEETGEPKDNQQGRRYQNYLTFCAERTDPIGESSMGMASIYDLGHMKDILKRPQETMNIFTWQIGHSCIWGQKTTWQSDKDLEEEGVADNRDEWVKKVDSSYFVADEWRDTAMLTGTPSAKVASTESLVNAKGTPAQVELEMFKVFTMDMALVDDIDGEIGDPAAGSSNSSESGTPGPVSADGWVWPSTDDSIVTSGFGIRNGSPHQGLDVAHNGGSDGKPIFAAQAGEVIAAGPASGFGNWIIIKHNIEGEHVDTVYGHMWDHGLSVSVGDTVEAGQEIGKIGNAGESYGAHLHFEIWPGGRLSGGSPIDPATVLQPPGGS